MKITENGYVVLHGQRLKSFLPSKSEEFAKDINVRSKTRQLGVFDFKAFLNIAMLLSESEKARCFALVGLAPGFISTTPPAQHKPHAKKFPYQIVNKSCGRFDRNPAIFLHKPGRWLTQYAQNCSGALWIDLIQ